MIQHEHAQKNMQKIRRKYAEYAWIYINAYFAYNALPTLLMANDYWLCYPKALSSGKEGKNRNVVQVLASQ